MPPTRRLACSRPAPVPPACSVPPPGAKLQPRPVPVVSACSQKPVTLPPKPSPITARPACSCPPPTNYPPPTILRPPPPGPGPQPPMVPYPMPQRLGCAPPLPRFVDVTVKNNGTTYPMFKISRYSLASHLVAEVRKLSPEDLSGVNLQLLSKSVTHGTPYTFLLSSFLYQLTSI